MPTSLDEVLTTAELARRPTRTPNYEAENRALTALAEAMVTSPQEILQKVVETAMDLCRADSAGINILEPGGAQGMFRWHAIAGQFASNVEGGIPVEASPSGVVLNRDASLLFAYPERHFAYGTPINPSIVEALVTPFHVGGKPVGTLWAIAHTPSRQFDAEDERLLTSLSRFAAVAHQMQTAFRMTNVALSAKADEVRQILDTSATAITRCSRDLRYLSVNAAHAKLVGLPTEQIIGRPIVDVIGAQAFDVIRPYIDRVLNGERVEYEAEYSLLAGGTRFVHVVCTPWMQAHGQVAGWVASVSDITDLKRATMALHESERKLREALRVGRMGYLDWNLLTNEIQWSPETYRLFGHEPGGAFSPTIEATVGMVPPEDLAFVQERLDAVIRGTAEYDIVHRMVRPDGKVVWVHAQGEVIRDKNDTPLRMLGTVVDVTERIQAEEALREREQRLRFALDASRAGSWTRDFRTDRAERDDRFREIYGFKAGEPVSFEAWLSRVHEEDRRRVLELWDQILHTKTQDTFDITFRIVRPDGTVSWIESFGQADRDADGQVMRLTGIEMDITERRRAEEALQACRDEERDRTLRKQADEALRRSHAELEQRTLQLRRLASDLTLAEQHVREELAKTLHDGLQQLLFSAVMTLDRAVAGNSQADQVALLQRASADIREAMEAARTLSMNLFPPMLHIGGLPAGLAWLAKRTQEQYGVVVNVTADPHANPEAGDVRILLFQAVRELLFNAVKHAHADRIDINLEVGPGDTIHIDVSDEGVGFDPVVTLHHKNQQHVGLGLFSIQERLAFVGGHLDIQSAPGKGARFSLTLPRSDRPRLATGAAKAGRLYPGWQGRLVYDSADGRSKPLRILIADDHVVARAGLRELFNAEPALQVVGEAANGVEAISQALALQPDVIVMDVSMPQINGIETTRQVRGALPHIQIVGLSTHDDENSERSMREAGAQAYFTKNEGADRLLNYLLSVQTQAKGAAKS